MKTTVRIALLLVVVLSWVCTPKTTEKTTSTVETVETPPETPAEPPKEEANLSPCPKFDDAPNPDLALENYVLYRDFMRTREWLQAWDYWQKVYAEAPAADGRRNTVFFDGIRLHEYFMSQESDSLEREKHIDAILALYDEMIQCYPEGGMAVGLKAFDLYYKYPHRADKEEIYQLFKQSIDTDSLEAQDFVINPFASLLVELFGEGKVSMEEAQHYVRLINRVLEHALANCEGEACQRWSIVEEYTPVRFEYFETVKGFYDCEYYKEKYLPEYRENPENCDVIREVYSRMKFGDCPLEDPQFQELIRQGNELCVEKGPAELAYECLKNADYDCAITEFEKAAAKEEDRDKKAHYTLLIAKIYHAHLRQFSKARQYALKAAEIKPNWGEPYLLIGRLYASSGPLCGPGRGWDSQIVTWPAIDMWEKAKRLDPSVAAEANKWIARYSKFMPSIEDIFQRGLKEGERFFVPCWIQEWTTIRAAR